MTVTTSQTRPDAHTAHAGGGGTPSPPAATSAAQPNLDALPGDLLTHDHGTNDAQPTFVVGDPSLLSAMDTSVPTLRPPAGDSLAHDHLRCDAQSPPVVGELSPPPAKDGPDLNEPPRVGEKLQLWAIHQGQVTGLAETVTDIEISRIAITNRIGAINRGLGRDSKARVPDDPETDRLWAIADGLEGVEKQAIKDLEKAMKAHPLGPWMKATSGVGLKQGARLLAALGNPYWNTKDDRPRRGPAELWAYCGFSVLPASHGEHEAQPRTADGQPPHPTNHQPHDPHIAVVGGVAQRRRKGVRANWNMQAQSRAYNIADSCVRAKATSPYGPLYEQAKAHYLNSVHHEDCDQCGICGSCGGLLGKNKQEHLAATGCDKRKKVPAVAGSPVTPGHADKRARRKVAKEVLKDLYLQAKAWHLATDHEPPDARRSTAGGEVPTPEAAP